MDNEDKQPVERPSMCRIEIIFPIASDEQALKIRRDISETLNELEKKQFRFSIVEG